MEKKKQSKKDWLWEFSKKLVRICSNIYVLVILYSLVIMAISQDYSALPTLITETANILNYCVFGYMVKAGVENVFKIKKTDEIL